MTAEQAIARSVSHTEIVTLDHDEDALEYLLAVCEDSVEANGLTETWGTTPDGDEWRVHVQARRGVVVSAHRERECREDADTARSRCSRCLRRPVVCVGHVEGSCADHESTRCADCHARDEHVCREVSS